MVTILIIITILLAFMGFPLLCVTGIIAAILFYFLTDVPLQAMITQISYIITVPLMSVFPIFTLMGYILNYGKTSQRLATFADSWLSWLPGGLAISAVISYSLFSAITGGSSLSVMALGGLYFAALNKSKYEEKFSLGICTVMGGGGIMFPPSLPIFIMAFIASQSVDLLFASALIPGITVIGLFIVYCIFNSIKTKVPRGEFSFKVALNSFKDVLLEAPIVVIIFGGIFLGWMTVNEVAILSLMYVILTQCIIRREVTFSDLKNATVDSMVLVGAIFAIMASALTLTNFLIDFEVPQKAVIMMKSLFSSKIVFLLLMNGVLLITGCLMEVFSAILVMVPLLLPVAIGYGIDPIHFAIIFIWNLEIGFSTPPIGFNLFVGAFRFKKPIESLWRASIPGICCQIVGLLVITYIPWLTSWLPDLLDMKPDFIQM